MSLQPYSEISNKLVSFKKPCSRCKLKIDKTEEYFLSDDITEHPSFTILTYKKDNLYCKRCYAIVYNICVTTQKEKSSNSYIKSSKTYKKQLDKAIIKASAKEEINYEIRDSQCQCIIILNNNLDEKCNNTQKHNNTAKKCTNEYNFILEDCLGYEKKYCTKCYENEQSQIEKLEKNSEEYLDYVEHLYFRERNEEKKIFKEMLYNNQKEYKSFFNTYRKNYIDSKKIFENELEEIRKKEETSFKMLDEIFDKELYEKLKKDENKFNVVEFNKEYNYGNTRSRYREYKNDDSSSEDEDERNTNDYKKNSKDEENSKKKEENNKQNKNDTNFVKNMSPEIKEAYNILEVSYLFTFSKIKTEYYKLALLYHPDKNPENTTEKFQNISSAYQLIKEWIG